MRRIERLEERVRILSDHIIKIEGKHNREIKSLRKEIWKMKNSPMFSISDIVWIVLDNTKQAKRGVVIDRRIEAFHDGLHAEEAVYRYRYDLLVSDFSTRQYYEYDLHKSLSEDHTEENGWQITDKITEPLRKQVCQATQK